MPDKPLTFVSVFAGIASFDLGLERAGMQCIQQIEVDDAACGVLKTHYPHVRRNIYDVRDASADNIPRCDVLCGGFPCTDVSSAGKRAGLAGKQSGLWFEFLRLLGELKPQWVIIENVRGLLSSNQGRDFAVILQGLVELRYGVCWRVLNAQYFGVPQRRRRVFIVGHLGDGRAAEVLFEPESGTGHSPSRRASGEETATTADGSTGVDSADTGGITKRKVIAFDWVAGGSRNDLSFRGKARSYIVRKGDYAMIRSSAVDAIAFTEVSPPLTSEGADSSEDGRGRHAFVGGPHGVRRLTPVESERLQGLPDNWTRVSSGEVQSDSPRYRQIGNAGAVPVIEWIGRRMVRASNT